MSTPDDIFTEGALGNAVGPGRYRSQDEVDKVVAQRAHTKSEEVALIRSRLGSSTQGHLARAADRALAAGTKPMSNDDWKMFDRAVGSAVRFSKLDDELAQLEQRFSQAGSLWVNEARVYGRGSPNSWYRDMAAAASVMGGGTLDRGVQERMTRYSAEVAHEIRTRSPEGRRAERLAHEYYRSDVTTATATESRATIKRQLAEMRAFTTGGGATASATGGGGAAFVSPFFAWEALAPYRGEHRTFADQCGTQPLPPYGLEVYVPYFSSATSVAAQTEGQSVVELDPGTGLRSAQVETVTGQLTLSQQLSDRAFTGDGGDFDRLVAKQLQQQLDQAIEQYVLSQALGSAATVSGQSSFSVGGFYQDLALAREQLTDTAGTRLRPTHVFSTSDLFSFISRQVDSSGRPIVTPQFAPGLPLAQGDASTKWSRFTGIVLPGSVCWFTADAIPNLGTTSETQIVISAPDEAVALFEGEPILAAYPQAGALDLEIVLNLRAYVAAVPRYPSGTATIAGPAYTAALV